MGQTFTFNHNRPKTQGLKCYFDTERVTLPSLPAILTGTRMSSPQRLMGNKNEEVYYGKPRGLATVVR